MEKPGPQVQRRSMSVSYGSSPLPTNSEEHAFSSHFEDYEIQSPIGYGSSAIVYNAIYIPSSKKVAIKIIDLDYFERNQIDELRRETQLMSLSKHANILGVHGSFVNDSKLYIVTPYMSAGSCLDIMKTAHPDGLEEVVIATILKQALQGLDYLHKQGYIHRDVKAGNLLMDDDGSVLLADFGVSSSLENGDRRNYRRTFVGTPCWMAPEVMEQNGYDYKADIWSFGITAIELATGHAPFAKYPPIKVLMLTISNDPPTLNRDSTKHKYTKSLKEMIDSCLQKDPTKRPNTEKLLSHAFFRQAKRKEFLVTKLLQNLPPLEERPHKRVQQKPVIYQRPVSWDFEIGDKGDDIDQVSIKEMEETSLLSADTSIPGYKRVSFIPSDDLDKDIETDATNSLSTKARHLVEEGSHSDPSVLLSSSLPTVLPKHSTSGDQIIQSSLPSQQYLISQREDGLNNQSSHIIEHHLSQQSQGEIKKGRFSVLENTKPREISASGGSQNDIETLQTPLSKESSNENLTTESRRGRFKFQVATSQPIDTQEANGLAPSKQRELPQSPSSLPRESAISRNETLQSREGPFSKQISRVQSENGINNEPTAEKIHGTKIGRFEVSSGKASTSETTYSPHSTHIGQSPGISPSSSISRGQGLKIESSSLYFHIQTLLKQNEAQHTILSELMGLNESEPIINFKAQQQKNMQKLLQINGNSGEGKFMTNEVTASLGALDRQIQSIIQENEELRKENEALKVKIEQLKKSSTVNITGGNTPMLSPNNLTTPATTSTATETALITITPSSSSNTNASH